MTSPAVPTLAIVIPVFNEEQVLPQLWQRLDAAIAASTPARWRMIFVDDGSRDGSAAWLRAKAGADARIELLELSRNFGHQSALSAGLAGAEGCDAVITMDADLQDPPELIPELVKTWTGGAEVVLAVRRSRQEKGVRRLGFDLFHAGFNRLADFEVRPNTGTFGLLSGEALAAYNSLGERHRFFPGLRAWVGFRVAEVVYDRHERAAGKPGQTFRRLVRYATDGIFSFSYLPLRVLTYVGAACASGGFLVGLYFIVKRLLGYETAGTGFTTLVTLMVFLGGVQLIGIGVLGEYLGRVYDEVKRRPLYILRRPAGAPTAEDRRS